MKNLFFITIGGFLLSSICFNLLGIYLFNPNIAIQPWDRAECTRPIWSWSDLIDETIIGLVYQIEHLYTKKEWWKLYRVYSTVWLHKVCDDDCGYSVAMYDDCKKVK